MKTFLNRLDQKYLSLGIAFVICLLVAAGIHAANAQTGPSASPPNGDVTPNFDGLTVENDINLGKGTLVVGSDWDPLAGQQTAAIDLRGGSITNSLNDSYPWIDFESTIWLKNPGHLKMAGAISRPGDDPVQISDNLKVSGNVELGDGTPDVVRIPGALRGSLHSETGAETYLNIDVPIKNETGDPVKIDSGLEVLGGISSSSGTNHVTFSDKARFDGGLFMGIDQVISSFGTGHTLQLQDNGQNVAIGTADHPSDLDLSGDFSITGNVIGNLFATGNVKADKIGKFRRVGPVTVAIPGNSTQFPTASCTWDNPGTKEYVVDCGYEVYSTGLVLQRMYPGSPSSPNCYFKVENTTGGNLTFSGYATCFDPNSN